jgi:hypothetical protein
MYDPNPFETKGKSKIVKKIEKEHGSVSNFIGKARKWLDKVPEGYVRQNPSLKPIQNKEVDLFDPKRLRILNRKITSIEHVEWLNSVIGRIEKMEEEIRDASLPPISTRIDREDEVRRKFQDRKKSALEFVEDVKEYAEKKLNVTEKQMKALNDTYKRYESLKSIDHL